MLTSPSYISPGEIDLFFEELNDFCEQQKSKKMVLFGIEEICNIAFAETYRAIIDYEFTNSQIRDLFISQIEALQTYSPNAVCYLPFMATAIKKNSVTLDHQNFVDITRQADAKSINDILTNQFNHSSILQPEDVQSFFLNNGFMSGFDIKKSNSFHNACIYDSGISINCDAFPVFFKSAQSVEILNPQIIIYDGYVQDVSEINLILNYSLENGTPFLIFAKGASQDVLNTCAVNLQMGKCKVCIIEPEISFWKDVSDTLVSALDVELYGSTTGRLLNNFEAKNEYDAEITIKRNEVFIKSKLLDLTHSAKTTIFLNENAWKKKGVLFDQLNFFSSTMQQIATCGIISNEKFQNITGIDVNQITGLENINHPSFSIVRALKEAETIINKIVNIGCLIKLER